MSQVVQFGSILEVLVELQVNEETNLLTSVTNSWTILNPDLKCIFCPEAFE
jgi:hypothetical protein